MSEQKDIPRILYGTLKKEREANLLRNKKEYFLRQSKKYREHARHQAQIYSDTKSKRRLDMAREYMRRSTEYSNRAKNISKELNRDTTHDLDLQPHGTYHTKRYTRKILSNMQQNLCGICTHPLDTTPHIDHITPRMEGGSDELWNLQLTHAQCNQRWNDKTNKPNRYWFRFKSKLSKT